MKAHKLMLYVLLAVSLPISANGEKLVGRIPVNTTVNEMGGAVVTIPIDVPAGINGLQPALSLVYNSQGGLGIAGWGWNLSGMSVISRVGKDYYHEGKVSEVKFNNQDNLALDGQRLVLFSGSHFQSGASYRTEIDTYNNIIYNPDNQNSFKVQSKEGLTTYYSNATGYQLKLGTDIYQWYASKIVDSYDNEIRYTYTATSTPYAEIVPTTIKYAISGGTEHACVTFVYQELTSPRTYYMKGSSLNRTLKNTKQLYRIQVASNGETLYYYDLDYDDSSLVPHLESVKKIAPNGDYLETLFSWSSLQEDTDRSTSFSIGQKDNLLYADFNGDGKVDILSYNMNSSVVVLNLNTSSGTTVSYSSTNKTLNHNYKQIQTLDLDGDGKQDIVGKYASGLTTKVAFQLSSGSGFTSNSYVCDASGTAAVLTGDFNGDGKDEFLVSSTDKMYSLSGNNVLESVTYSGIPSSIKDNLFDWNRKYRALLDFNGNGKTDLFVVSDNTVSVYELSDTGNTFSRIMYYNLASDDIDCDGRSFSFGDINGDGCSDFVYWGPRNDSSSTTLQLRVYLSRPNSGFTPLQPLETGVNRSSVKDVFSYDVNNDGFGDITYAYLWGDVVQLRRELNRGDSSYDRTTSLLNMDKEAIEDIEFPFQMIDLRGNGRAELVCMTSSDTLYSKSLYIDNPNLMTSVTDNLGQTSTFHYRPLTDNSIYTSNCNYSFPCSEGRLPLYVVDAAASAYDSKNYRYKNLRMHRQGKGLLGFEERSVIDSMNNVRSTIHNGYSSSIYLMYPNSTTVTTLDGETISATSRSYAFRDLYNLPILSVVVESESQTDYLTTLQSSSNYTYDNYGNMTSCYQVMGNLNKKVEYEYATQASWCPNKPVYKISWQRIGSDIVYDPSVCYSYNDRGKLSGVQEEGIAQGLRLTSQYTYDSYGNCTSTTTSGSGQTRTSSCTYSADGRFMMTETDELGARTSYGYDTTKGWLTSLTDTTGTTTYQYDVFGRLKRTEYPDGTESVTTMNFTNATGTRYSVAVDATNAPSVTTWYNAAGREVCQCERGFNDDADMAFTVTRYLPNGKVSSVSEPFFGTTAGSALSGTFSTDNAMVYTYDAYGRVVHEESPAVNNRYSYNGLTSTVTTKEGQTTSTLDASGMVVSRTLVDDSFIPIDETPDRNLRWQNNSKSVTYSYYPTGAVRTITPQGGTAITMQYDAKGNRIELIDPDAGVICDSYNAFGQQTYHSQSVGNGTLSETGFTYAVNGRLVADSITGNETISRYYTYDSRFPDLIRRIEYDNDDYVSYTYDRFGRLSRSDRQAGSTTLSDSYSYSAGLLMSHKHIVSGVCKTEETFTYDNFGHLVKSGISPSTTVWELLEVNPRGQVVQEKKGNIVTTYTYDDAGRILNISAPGIVDLSYTYDYAGNVLTKTDDITNQRASYTYDGKRRLTSWRTECPYLDSDPVADLSLRSAPLLVDVTHTITYDGSTGNITSKSDIGTNTSFTYNPQDKPHALRSVSGVTANWGTNTASIGYNDYGQLETIEQDNTTYSIQYSPDGRRIMSDLREGNSTFTVRYYGNGIEKAFSGSDDIDYLTYLCSGAIVVHHEGSGGALRAAPPSTPTAILQGYYDAQGSLIALVNGNGTVARRYAYDPWGKRVNPTNWTQPDTSADIYHINRGYTMHEHLDDFGLINMNGRVFDPSVAQFLSPDNYIQSDGNWLNYNRYAYCYNNPLSYTDPSGEIVAEFLVGAAIGGAFNVVAHWNKISCLKDGLIAFGIGALAGGIGGAIGAPLFAVAGGIDGGFVAGALNGATAAAYSIPVANAFNYEYFNDSYLTSKDYLCGIAGGAVIGGLINGFVSCFRGGEFLRGSYTDEAIYSTPINECVVENGDCVNGAMKVHLPDVDESTWANIRQLSTDDGEAYVNIGKYPGNAEKELGIRIIGHKLNTSAYGASDFYGGLEGSRYVLMRYQSEDALHAYALESITKRTYNSILFNNVSKFRFNVWNPTAGEYTSFWGIHSFNYMYRF